MAAISISSGRITSGLADLWYVPRVRNAKHPLVVFQTGGSDTPATTGLLGARPTLDALVMQEGFCVVQLTAGPWGASVAQSRIADAITWGRANLACTADPPVMVGISNGAVCSLQYARQNDVAAVISFIVPVDLNYLRDNDIASTRAGIDATFGVTWSSPGVQPLPAHADLYTDAAAYTGKPIQMWTSSNDTLNNPGQTQQAWAATIGADWHNLGAVGHDYDSMNTVDVPTVVDFILDRV